MRCAKCNRLINDPESLARGIGPVCWAKDHPAVKRPLDWYPGKEYDDERQLRFDLEIDND